MIFAVKAGQFYRVPRQGKPARHIKVTRVTGKYSHQPTVHYVEVTRSGKKKPGMTLRRPCQCTDGKTWTIGPGFELIDGPTEGTRKPKKG